MSKCYTFVENGKTLSQKQVVDEIRNKLMSGSFENLASKLLSQDISTQTEIISKLETINAEARQKGTNYQGVTNYIEDYHKLTDDPDAKSELLVPKFNEENYIKKAVEDNKEDGIDPSLTEETIRQQLLDSQLEKEIGTLQHALLQVLFETNGNSSSQSFKDVQKEIKKHLDDKKDPDGEYLESNKRTLREIITENNPSLSDDEIVAKLTDNALKIYNSITSRPEYTNAKFFAEWAMSLDNSKVKVSDDYRGIKRSLFFLLPIYVKLQKVKL